MPARLLLPRGLRDGDQLHELSDPEQRNIPSQAGQLLHANDVKSANAGTYKRAP